MTTGNVTARKIRMRVRFDFVLHLALSRIRIGLSLLYKLHSKLSKFLFYFMENVERLNDTQKNC